MGPGWNASEGSTVPGICRGAREGEKRREYMRESFGARVRRGDLLIGTIVSMPSPEAAEILSMAGFDWLFVDMEHGAIDIATAQHILQAADSRVPCVVRVPSMDEVWIKKCLDIGAAGIIVPQIRSAEDAETVVSRSKYPPAGNRSVGVGRAHGYGSDFTRYVTDANDDIALIVQIENSRAVGAIESIVAVPGIDAVFVGPYDLSGSMGKLGEVDDEEVQAAISHVGTCAARASMASGIFVATAEAAADAISRGFRLIAVSMDAMLLAGAGRDLVSALRT